MKQSEQTTFGKFLNFPKVLIRIFFWGFAISFLGTLPLGTVNVTATNVTVKYGVMDGLLFSAGCIVIETVCLIVVLIAIDWLVKKQKIFRVFEWLTLALIIIMALSSFIAASKMHAFGENVLTAYNVNPFVLGLLLSALNPLHIPFWIGWTTVLIDKEVFYPTRKNNLFYFIGITLGTMLGFTVFVYGGNYIIKHAAGNAQFINYIVGAVLLITGVVQLYKIIYKPGRKISMV